MTPSQATYCIRTRKVGAINAEAKLAITCSLNGWV